MMTSDGITVYIVLVAWEGEIVGVYEEEADALAHAAAINDDAKATLASVAAHRVQPARLVETSHAV